MDRNANANGSYIDPRWTPTYLVTRKGESVAELYAQCEEFLRAFIGRVEGRRPSLSPSTSALAAVPNGDDGEHGEYREHGVGVGVGHKRVLLVSYAATTIVLTRALTGDAGLAGGVLHADDVGAGGVCCCCCSSSCSHSCCCTGLVYSARRHWAGRVDGPRGARGRGVPRGRGGALLGHGGLRDACGGRG